MQTGRFTVLIFTAFILLAGCLNKGSIIREVHIGYHQNNRLKIELNITTVAATQLYIRYWPDSSRNNSSKVQALTKDGLSHYAVLCNVLPNTRYNYEIVTGSGKDEVVSKMYDFQTGELPEWLKGQFKYACTHPELLPKDFKEGFMLLNKRETPGVAYIIDYKGNLRWYHTIENTGLKVTHFTPDKTIISILGSNDEPTSYGSEILEVNVWGDTVLHLKKGQNDFQQTIHHEILRNSRGHLVTLTEEKQVVDLSSIGGAKNDTINTDGILVMDDKGRKIWKWTVLDAEDPLKEKDILKNKSDWTHANSLSYDPDSNYLISFYNTGQIWKVDANTGKVIWKLGKNGTLKAPSNATFDQSHTVHINANKDLMFFDNGVAKEQSQVFALHIDPAHQTAAVSLNIKLPKEVYNARMGSAYLIDNSAVLCCCSKRHIVVLVNTKGEVIWTLDTAIPPYRADFLTKQQLSEWL